jgi:D-alanyl-D-alanine dipeptidase
LFVSAVVAAAEPDLVDIRLIDPTIVVELRYAGKRNIANRQLYPQGMPALVRPVLARKLAQAQGILRRKGFGLKIWDAYRPKHAHDQLWQFSPMSDYVADPEGIGSLHTWGMAVDATMIDSRGRDVRMPTDFDDFSPSAMLHYTGPSNEIRRNLWTLQNAMRRAGFNGVRTEWWHFVAQEWKSYGPIAGHPLAGLPHPPQPRRKPPTSPPLPAAGGMSSRHLSTSR